MAILNVRHTTIYRYIRPVRFGDIGLCCAHETATIFA